MTLREKKLYIIRRHAAIMIDRIAHDLSDKLDGMEVDQSWMRECPENLLVALETAERQFEYAD